MMNPLKLLDQLLFWIFVKLIKRWFSVVVTYTPNRDDEVRAIHMAKDEETLRESVKELYDDMREE